MARPLINDKYSFSIGDSKYQAKDIHYGGESLASEDSGRTLDGEMHITWVKRNLRKFEIILPPCHWDIIHSLVNKVQGQFYNIYIFDPFVNDFDSFYVYTSNSKADVYSGIIRGGLFENFEFHAIEAGR